MHAVRTIAMINQKGGVGKTTTVANLGKALAERSQSVCLIDMDPQAHLTLHFGIEPTVDQPSLYDVLVTDLPLTDAVVTPADELAVVPSSIDLAGAEVELAATVGREQILRDRIAVADLDASCILMDCPPSLGLLTLNALAAADEVIIPLQPHFLALQGLGKLLETVSLVQRRINPSLRVSGVILCMYESNTRLAGEVRDDLQAFINQSRDQDLPWAGARVFQTVIRRNVKLAECPSYGTTIFQYDPTCHGAADYAALADEFLSALPGEDDTASGSGSAPDASAFRQPASPAETDRTPARATETFPAAMPETRPAPTTRPDQPGRYAGESEVSPVDARTAE
jgi:chromosome partitioning protein